MSAVFKRYKVNKLVLGIALFSATADPALVVGEDYVTATDPQALSYIETRGQSELTYQVEELDREINDGKLGWKSKIQVGGHFKVTTEVEMAGSGTAANKVAYDGLMQISALASDASSGTHVDYTQLDDDDWPDATIYLYFDGALHKILNAQSNMKWSLATKAIPTYSFEVTGIYGGIVAASIPSPSFTQIKPAKVGDQHTIFTLDSVEYALVNISGDQNNEVVYSDIPGYEGVSIDNFQPQGEFEILCPDLGDFDPWALVRSEDDVFLPFSLVHGTTAGNIVTISNDEIQLLTPSYGEFEGKRTYKIPYGCVGYNTIRTA